MDKKIIAIFSSLVALVLFTYSIVNRTPVEPPSAPAALPPNARPILTPSHPQLPVAKNELEAQPPSEAKNASASQKQLLEIRFLQKRYRLSSEKIREFQENGYQTREVIQLHVLAELTKKDAKELMRLRSRGKVGWGKFVHDLRVSPLELNTNVRARLAAFAKEESKREMPKGMKNPLPAKKAR